MGSIAVCKLCGLSKAGLLYKKDEFNILKCSNCGFIFNENYETSADELEVCQNLSLEVMKTYYEKQKALYFDRFRKDLRKIKEFKKGAKLLDIGCGFGFFLKLAEEEGFDCYGLEIDRNTAEFVRVSLGLNVHYGKLDVSSYPDNHFDIITLFHVLEHIPDLNGTLSILYRILKPDGIILIDVPNVNDVRRFFLKQNWPMFKKHHLWYFSLRSLNSLLHKHGFKIFEVLPHGGSEIVFMLGLESKGSRISYAVAKYYNYLRPVKNIILQMLWRIGFTEDITVYAKKAKPKKESGFEYEENLPKSSGN